MKFNENIIEKINKILMVLILRFAYDLIYITIITRFFSTGNFFLDYNFKKYLLSIVLILLYAIPIYDLVNLDNPSNVIITLINIFYFLPCTTMFGLAGFSYNYFIFVVIYWGLLLLFQYKINFKFEKEKIIKIKSYIFIILITILLVAISIFISGYYNGFKLNFSLKNVYDLRANAKTYNIPGILQYLRMWAVKIIPIVLVISLLKNKKIIPVLLIIAQFLLFSFDGSKTSIFTLVFAIMIWMFLNKNSYKIVYPVFWAGTLILNYVGIIIDKAPLSVSYFHRRMMFLPNLLSNYYYQYFSVNEKLYLRQSILRFFKFSNPYKLNANFLISDVFFNKVEMSSNNGLIGDAFANFGWISLLIYPLLIILILKVLDFSAQNVNVKITFAVCVEMFIMLTNQSLFTALLTGGILAIIILFLVIPKDEELIEKNDVYDKLVKKIKDFYNKKVKDNNAN